MGMIDNIKDKMSGMDDAMIQRMEMLKNKEQQTGLNDDERSELNRLMSKMPGRENDRPME